MKKRARSIKIPNPDYLNNVALFYLGRYAASEASLRRVLRNKIRRAALVHAEFAVETAKHKQLHDVIETIIDKHRRLGVLNDAAFAEAKAGSMRRAGCSGSYIRNKLAQKGVKSQIVGEALERIDAQNDNPYEAEMIAAKAFAKRKKLVPFRKGKNDELLQRKELAAMARAGFSYDIAQKILGSQLEDDDLPA